MKNINKYLLIILLMLLILPSCFIKTETNVIESNMEKYKEGNSNIMGVAIGKPFNFNVWDSPENPYYMYIEDEEGADDIVFFAQFTDANYEAAKGNMTFVVHDNEGEILKKGWLAEQWDDAEIRYVKAYKANNVGDCRIVLVESSTGKTIETIYVKVIKRNTIYIKDTENNRLIENPGTVSISYGEDIELVALLNDINENGNIPDMSLDKGSGFYSLDNPSIVDMNEWKRNDNVKRLVKIKLDSTKEGKYTVKLGKNGQEKNSINVEVVHETYTIKFNTNGGNEIEKQTYKESETTSEPEAPKKEGYAFEGWYTDSELTNLFTWGKLLSSNKTLYAKWSILSNYEFLEGQEQVYNILSDDTAKFRIKADYSLFEKGSKVYVDGKLVDSSNYTSESGSTIIKFKKSFMKSLSIGSHELKVVFSDSTIAATTFTVDNSKVAEEKVENPSTGISLGYAIMILLILIGGIAYIFVRKQSKFPKHN